MPKRQCPFGESSSHQWKMHVGKKEVDMGVRSEELMKSVYGKCCYFDRAWLQMLRSTLLINWVEFTYYLATELFLIISPNL